MNRRRAILLLGAGAAAWPLAARAEQPTSRLGIITIQPRASPPYATFDQRLRELGYVEGEKNIVIEFVSGDFGIDEATKELLRRKVDIILAPTEPVLRSAMAVSRSLPIVMIAIDYDPLTLGYVRSLARPGGNVTGIFAQQIELTAKRVQFLKDALPDLQAATVFWDGLSVDQWKATQAAAATIGLQVAGIELREQPYDYERALTLTPPDHRNALIVSTSPVFYRDRQRVAELALRHRMASIFVLREWVEAGGLLSYGVNFPALFRRAAEFVDRILKGAKPADLPVEQPTKFELIADLKTANALGLAMPTSILLRADEVIE
jgi:putative tryptophan/tyrosine transport system substrate-binding protein